MSEEGESQREGKTGKKIDLLPTAQMGTVYSFIVLTIMVQPNQ